MDRLNFAIVDAFFDDRKETPSSLNARILTRLVDGVKALESDLSIARKSFGFLDAGHIDIELSKKGLKFFFFAVDAIGIPLEDFERLLLLVRRKGAYVGIGVVTVVSFVIRSLAVVTSPGGVHPGSFSTCSGVGETLNVVNSWAGCTVLPRRIQPDLVFAESAYLRRSTFGNGDFII